MTERLGILISGSGTTAAEIIQACKKGEIPLEVGCVIASKSSAGGIKKALELGIPHSKVVVVDRNTFRSGPRNYVDQTAFGHALLDVLLKNRIDVVSQNGWLPRTPKLVVEAYINAIFNQHPGPKYETGGTFGIQPHAIMLYLARATGINRGTEVIVHRVTENYDEGATVGIQHVDIDDIWESPQELQQKALQFEHVLVKSVLKRYANGTLKDLEAPPPQHMLNTEEHRQLLAKIKDQVKEKYKHG